MFGLAVFTYQIAKVFSQSHPELQQSSFDFKQHYNIMFTKHKIRPTLQIVLHCMLVVQEPLIQE